MADLLEGGKGSKQRMRIGWPRRTAGGGSPRWRRARWWVAAALVLVLAGSAVFMGVRRFTAKPLLVPEPAVVALTIGAPAILSAGAPLTLTISAQPPVSGTTVFVTAQGTDGPIARTGKLVAGEVQVVIPPQWTQAAGAVMVQATAGTVSTQTALVIVPGAAVNPLFALTGPRSAPVGGDDGTMVVAVPVDSFGNAANDGTVVVIRAQQPGRGTTAAAQDLFLRTTSNLFAAVRVATRTIAGALTAAATSGNAHSPGQTVRVTPGTPLTVTLVADPRQAPADGETTVLLQTGRLADRFHNPLLDGAYVAFVVTGSDGTRRWLPASTLDGRASTVLRASLEPTTQVVRALVAGMASAPVTVTFTAVEMVKPFELTATHQDDAVVLTVGPVIGSLGQLVADETPVTFVITDRYGQQQILVALTHYGLASLTLYAGEKPPGIYQAEATVAGITAARSFVLPDAVDPRTDR